MARIFITSSSALQKITHMSKFFSRLSYSFGNEDWSTEQHALKIQRDNRVLCITASGDRPLNLLLQPCREMIAIDANPTQSHLLQLKSTALQHLEFEEYLEFLGSTHCYHRLHLFNKIKKFLPPGTMQYWLENAHMIENGVLYQGATEKWSKRLSVLPQVLCKRQLNKLFTMETLCDQKKFLEKEWNHKLWLSIFRLGMHPLVSRLFFKDPGLFKHLPRSLNPGEYYYKRMIDNLHRNLARENPLISLTFKGHVGSDALPPYLTPQGTQSIRPNLNQLSIVTQEVINYLEGVPQGTFDRFSLSDVVSYLDYPRFVKLLKAIRHAAKPGARFCLRQFMSRYAIPKELESSMIREPELEKQLEHEDRAFVYHFTVGTIP